MKRFKLITFFISVLFVITCGPVMKVNSYKLDDPLPSASFCAVGLIENPALNEETKRKVIKVLQAHRVKIESDCSQADYILVFGIGVQSERRRFLLYYPVPSYQTTYGNIYGDFSGSFYSTTYSTKYLPIQGTKIIYHKAMVFMLIDRRELELSPNKPKIIWQLEVYSRSRNADLRKDTDYFLAILSEDVNFFK